jgi:outer membrane protein assembly factor BamB
MKQFTSLEERFTFGKYKGERLAAILRHHNSYITWCYQNIPNFSIKITDPEEEKQYNEIKDYVYKEWEKRQYRIPYPQSKDKKRLWGIEEHDDDEFIDSERKRNSAQIFRETHEKNYETMDDKGNYYFEDGSSARIIYGRVGGIYCYDENGEEC